MKKLFNEPDVVFIPFESDDILMASSANDNDLDHMGEDIYGWRET